MSNLEKRALPFEEAELRVEQRDNKPVIVGYAAVFNRLSGDLGGFRERIKPGAFDNALTTSDVRALVNHDASLILGRSKSGTLRLSTDSKGLRYEITPPDSSMAAHYVEAIKRGDISGSSFAFTVDYEGDGAAWERANGEMIREVRGIKDLFDVGPVTYPAYPDTTVAARSLERFLAAQAQAEPPADLPAESMDSYFCKLRLASVS